ncbi:MAG: DUF2239 family protein [Acidobacteria bacterium]|nr:DUF2239 family protein [Acidobacteriota bacterium]
MPYLAFAGPNLLATGDLPAITQAVRSAPPTEPVLVFDAVSSLQIDLDLRESPPLNICSLRPTPPIPAPGPSPNVIAREVSLLPRHWAWLDGQPGGASVALRKLVEAARRAQAPQDQLRAAQESAYRFLSAMAGNLPGFEDATRALFAHQPERFTAATAPWPEDIQAHARHLAAAAFSLAPQHQIPRE